MTGEAMARRRGFTLIELLVTLAILATLLTLALPRYGNQVERAREATLRQNLATLRDVLDKFHADSGHWPAALEELVRQRYLREVPLDPFTGSRASWRALPPPEGGAGIYDVRSSAPGRAQDGSAFAEW